ncbi:MAG: hypothetical protein R6U28_05080 [Cyclonatronaceae bacterium]
MTENRSGTTDRITLDRESNEHIRRFKRSLNKVRISQTLMQLFWTAGPVTGLGLIGGYYLGFGRMPSLELLIYFISFTALSGIIGLVARLVYVTARGHLEEQGKRDILDVTDKLGDLILVMRDMNVQAYEGGARRREAALQLLRRVDLTSYGVTIAFTDLTGKSEVGKIMGRIYTYRRIGLYSRARELYTEHRKQINEATHDLEQISPAAARELWQWFTGGTLGMSRSGVPREPDFLQRVMSSIENNNPLLMTFRDVEEMIILAFELISGREIPTLVFEYSGRWKFARALDELEVRRSEYLVYQARGGNRFRALAAYLVETGYVNREELPEGMTIYQLVDEVTAVIDRLAEDLEEASVNLMKKNGEITKSGRASGSEEQDLNGLIRILKTSLELYSMAYRAYRETGRRHARLIEASQRWEKMVSDAYGNPGELNIGSARRGIHIIENTISLDEDARLEVCRHLTWFFEKLDVRRTGFTFTSPELQSATGEDNPEWTNRSSTAMAARHLAIEIALALEPHIKLTKPEIRRNINATKAIYLGKLSPEMNATRKAELGKEMAQEADDRLDVAAEQMADTLVRLYDVDMTEEAREFLHYTYGARLEVLDQMKKRADHINKRVSHLNERPPLVEPPKSHWAKILSEARKHLRQGHSVRR